MKRALGLALLLFATCRVAAEPPREPPRTWALLVGCSEYPMLRRRLPADVYEARVRLQGPEQDVAAFAAVLTEAMGVAKERITVLSGWSDDDPGRNPTRDNIVRALVRLSRSVTPGDRVIFHFAGHGSRVPDLSGDEADGLDEVLLPADVRAWDAEGKRVPGAILDDEVGERLRAIRDAGASVWAVFDCCHAGTMVRGGDGATRTRRLPGDLLGIPSVAARGAPDRGGLVEGDTRGIAATYAVGADQRCAEMRLPRGVKDAPWRGLLTWALVEDLRRTKGVGDLAALDRRLADAYLAASFQGARPFSEGDPIVSPAGPGAVTPPPALPFPLPDARVPVAVVDAAGAPVALSALGPAERAALEKVASNPRFPWVSDPSEAAWLVVRLGPSRFVLRPAALGDGADEAFAPTGPDLDLRTPLEQIARRDNLCRLAASGAAADPTLGLAVELRVGPSEAGAPPPGAASTPLLADGSTIRPGDTLRIDVRNGGTRPLDVWLFLLDASYGVSVVFPAADATPRLAPGTAAPTIEGFVQDASLGEEHLLAIAVPADVAAPPVDLRWLEAPPLLAASARARSPSGGGALGDLLAAYAFPPRAGARTPSTLPAGPASVTMRTWTTAWGPVVPTPMPGTADLPGTDAAAATDDDPSTWFVGPRVFVGASGPGARGANLALSGGDLVEALGVAPAGDLLLQPRDGQGRYPFAAAPLPCVLRLLPGRRIASYDTDLDHIHDLQLLDRDADGFADARRVRVHVGREGVVSAWSPWEPVHVPWLRASAVQGSGPDAADRLDRAIRALRWVVP